MKKYLSLYKNFFFIYLKKIMEYRADFIIGLIGFFIIQGSGIMFLNLIFEQIPNLNGWTYNEILFIYGFSQIPRGIDHLITDNFWNLSSTIILKGEFDRYLLRPINSLFHLIAEVIQPDAIGELIIGVFLLIWSITKLEIQLTPLSILLGVFTIICGTLIYSSIKLIFASIAFWTKNSFDILWMNYSLSDFSKYPMTIYSKPIQAVLTFFVPFGFTAFIPASYFLNKNTILVSIGGTFVATICLIFIAYTIWTKGIRAYESSGN